MGEQLELFPNEKLPMEDKKYIKKPEWCFQFFDNEPVPFAYSKEDDSKSALTLEVYPTEGEGLQFYHNGMTFKIFVREMNEETKELIKNENQN